MNTNTISNKNIILTGLFALLSIFFIVVMATNQSFFDWTFARHQNILSWYIRPLFLLPFCYFAYKRNPFGISLTIFLLLTSMFWFNEPITIDGKVKEFLLMEKEYLTTNWDMTKILITSMVPVLLGALVIALWKRSLKGGVVVLILIAVIKTIWSLVEGGEAGTSIILPAILGLVICISLIYYGFKRSEKNTN